jgi:hypothetical protein
MPPTLDLANRELVRATCTPSGWPRPASKLGNSIRDLLDMNHPKPCHGWMNWLPTWTSPRAVRSARTSAVCVLSMLKDELTPAARPWFTEARGRNPFSSAPTRAR